MEEILGSLLGWDQGMVYRCPMGDGEGRENQLRGGLGASPVFHSHTCRNALGAGEVVPIPLAAGQC